MDKDTRITEALNSWSMCTDAAQRAAQWQDMLAQFGAETVAQALAEENQLLHERLLRKQTQLEERQELMNACYQQQEQDKKTVEDTEKRLQKMRDDLLVCQKQIAGYEEQLLRMHKNSAKGLWMRLIARLKGIARRVLRR